MSLEKRIEDLNEASSKLDLAAEKWLESRFSSNWRDFEEAEKQLDESLQNYKSKKSKLEKTEKRLAKKMYDPDLQDVSSDLVSHHIEGIAAAAYERGIKADFSVPLISRILPNLYMGGCNGGVILVDTFDLVVSLYPWEKYIIDQNKTERVEVTAFDSSDTSRVAAMWEAAGIARKAYNDGKKVLIHCQAGLNRSGLVTAMVLMQGIWTQSRYHRSNAKVMETYTADSAIQLLRRKRHQLVLCNEHFERYLLEYR